MAEQPPDQTRVDIDLSKGRVTVFGAAFAVILIVALISMAYVCGRAMDLGEHAIDRSAAERVIDP